MTRLWLLLLVAFPVLVPAYFVGLSVAAERFTRYRYDERHDGWLYLAFVGGLAIVVLRAFPSTLSFQFEPATTLSLAAGVGLYRADTAVQERLSGRPVRRGRERLTWTLPNVAIAPAEELLFRGIPTLLVPEYGAAGYVAFSAALFGVSHYQEGRREVAFKTVNGVVYCVLYLVTGSLVAPMLAHVGYNAAYVRTVTADRRDGRRRPVKGN